MREGQPLRDKLKSGATCLGTFTTSSDPCLTELLCGSGFDFLVIDAEHGALNIESVQANIMATMASDTVPIIRVPNSDEAFIKCVLDAGAGGVLVPQVRDAEDARRAVAACLYPPEGIRGFGPRRPANYERNYAEVSATANDHIVVWAQIENTGAVDEIEEIVRIPHLAGVLIGPNDLAAALGLIFQKDHPRVLEAIDTIKAAAQAAGLPVGMAGLSDPESAVKWLRAGFQFATLGNINGLLMRASRGFVDSVKQGIA
jgi:2-keto-3-deoxy-L-rhamnonate aldolase RhmA